MSSMPPSGGIGSVPRKLIAAQAVVVIGLVALIYFTLLRPDEGGPPRVVDAPGQTQAGVPDGTRQDPRGSDPADGRPGAGGDPGPRGGVASDTGRAGAPGQGAPDSPGFPGDPGGPGDPASPGGPSGPGDGAPPSLDGDGGYGPGDDQYGNSITRLEDRLGLGSPASTP